MKAWIEMKYWVSNRCLKPIAPYMQMPVSSKACVRYTHNSGQHLTNITAISDSSKLSRRQIFVVRDPARASCKVSGGHWSPSHEIIHVKICLVDAM